MRIFCDMDGVLAEYPLRPDWWLEPGVFRQLPPQPKMIEAVRKLMAGGAEVSVLSSCDLSGPRVREEKDAWLDRYLPELPLSRRIYTAIGKPKADQVPGGISASDILLDDYNPNLRDWKRAGGTAVKVLNGINSPDSWSGLSTVLENAPEELPEVLKRTGA